MVQGGAKSTKLAYLLTQHLFLTFMWEVVQGVGPRIFEGASVFSNLPVMDSIANAEMSPVSARLENQVLSQLATDIHQSGLCSIEDARLCIVPSLCHFKLLPHWDTVVGFVTKDLRPAEVQGKWDQVVPVYTRLLQECSSWGQKHPLSLHVTAIVLETLHIVVDKLIVLKNQEINDTIQVQGLQRARDSLEATLKQQFPRPHSKTLDHFAMLYRFQLRFNPKVWFKFNITKESLLDTIKDAKQTENALHFVYGYFEQPEVFEHLKSVPFDDVNCTMHDGRMDLAENLATEWRDALGWTPLHYAIRLGDLEAVKVFHDHYRQQRIQLLPDASGRSSLYNACEAFKSPDEYQNYRKVIQPLIKDAGSGLQARDGRYMLHYAAVTGNDFICELLLQEHANIEAEDSFRQRPIHIAAFCGNLGVLDNLLKRRANVGARDSWGRTAQHLAALRGHGKVIQRLHEESNILIQVEDNAGQIPIFLAVLSGHDKVIDQLLKLQPEVVSNNRMVRDRKGRTLLHLAALRGHSSIIPRLLELNNSWIKDQDQDGRTPLHLAALEGYDLVTEQLLKVSSRQVTRVQDYDGRTALELAELGGHYKVVEVFTRMIGAIVDDLVLSGGTAR